MHMHTNMHRRTSTHQRTHKAHAHTRTRAHSAERRVTADGLGVAEQPQGGVGTDKTMGDEARPTFFWEVTATVSGSPASPPGGVGDVDLDPMALDSTPPPQPSDTNPAPSSAIRGRAGGVEGLPPSLSPNERELEGEARICGGVRRWERVCHGRTL